MYIIYIYNFIYIIFYVYFFIFLLFYFLFYLILGSLKYLIPGERLLLILFMCNANINRKGLLLRILFFSLISHLEASFNHQFCDFSITTFSFTSR